LLRESKPKTAHLTRIENRHGGGIPDCFCLLDKLPLWLELKIQKSERVKLSPHQVAWHISFWAQGGLSFFLIKAPSAPYFHLFQGSQAIDLAQKPMSEVQGLHFENLNLLWEALRTEVRDHYANVLRV
jgi:Holliday junction resolvase